MRQQVYAHLPSYNPFVGSFHHAPSAGNRGAAYFAGDIVFVPELEMRKKLRQNPFAGTFHALPGYYDPLHGLKNFRKMKYENENERQTYVEIELDVRNSEPIIMSQPMYIQRQRSHSESDMNLLVVQTPKLKPRSTRRSSAADISKGKRSRSKSHHQKSQGLDFAPPRLNRLNYSTGC